MYNTRKRKAFVHRQWIWPSYSRNRVKSSLTGNFMEMLTSAPSLGSAQMKSLHFDCKFPLSWGWMHRQIKLRMYFSEVWLTMCQSDRGRQPVCYQRSSSGRALHCAHSHPPPATQDREMRATMPKLRATQKPLFIPLSPFPFIKVSLYLLAICWIGERAALSTQSKRRRGWREGRVENVSISS